MSPKMGMDAPDTMKMLNQMGEVRLRTRNPLGDWAGGLLHRNTVRPTCPPTVPPLPANEV